jgi:hypothetical protein
MQDSHRQFVVHRTMPFGASGQDHQQVVCSVRALLQGLGMLDQPRGGITERGKQC